MFQRRLLTLKVYYLTIVKSAKISHKILFLLNDDDNKKNDNNRLLQFQFLSINIAENSTTIKIIWINIYENIIDYYRDFILIKKRI